MSKKPQRDLVAEIELERKENYPQLKQSTKATVLAKNSNGLYLDIAKNFEGYVNPKELGDKSLDEYTVGEVIDVYVAAEDRNHAGIFKLSIKQLEDNHKWERLESLKDQELQLKVSKILKSGIEVQIEATKQIGFIPYGYLDMREEPFTNKDKNTWLNLLVPGKIHELDQSRNKIILNHKTLAEEGRKLRAKKILSNLAIGQKITGTIVRTTDFGVFVDIGGLDALIPSSELSWARFKKPSDIARVGDSIDAVVFKVDIEKDRVALSVKQALGNPWANLDPEIKVGYQNKGKVVTKAEFGVFVEIVPGVEALLHKSNFADSETPEQGQEIEYEVINLETEKKRMGIKLKNLELSPNHQETVEQENQQKEPEHV